jgi:spore coat protein A
MAIPGTPGVGVIPNVMKFVVGSARGHLAELPTSLRPLTPLDPGLAATTRDLVLDKSSGDPCTGTVWRINGLGWNDVTERPVLGTTEIWRFVNLSGTAHPMHMHLVAFQVLDRQPITVVGGGWTAAGPPVPPAAVEAGWKDTVAVGPGEAVRVIARFEDFLGAFPYHCHMLEHEDHEMMRQFETIEPGAPTATPADGCGCGAGGGLDLAAVGGILLALLRPARLSSARTARLRRRTTSSPSRPRPDSR